MENEILTIAKQLVAQGKTPTIALVKGKLSRRVAMPILIQALQRFDSLSIQEQQAITTQGAPAAMSNSSEQESLADQVVSLRQDVNELKKQIAVLNTTVAALTNSENTAR